MILLESIGDMLASREWLLLMMLVIVVAAFVFPDYRMGEAFTENKDDQDDKGGKEERD
jgi:hypothetical protein